jgi:arginine decarboxylase
MKNYFITNGSGESNLSRSKNHTTSYDDAVVNAGIGNVNVVNLSSMIPPGSIEVPYISPKWGDVVYCIMARNDSKKGKFISCALLISEVYYENKLLGSFVLEYSGNGNVTSAQKNLFMDLYDMVERRNYGSFYEPLKMYTQNKTKLNYNIIPQRFIYKSLKIKKRHGTVICSICFI